MSSGSVGAAMQRRVPAPMMASTSRRAARRPMKSLHLPITGPAMAPARKNMDCTGAALSAPRPKLAAICGSAGVTMLALSWKDSTPRSRVEMRRAARRPLEFGLVHVFIFDGGWRRGGAGGWCVHIKLLCSAGWFCHWDVSCYTTMYDEQVQPCRTLFPNSAPPGST
jgi:hypothetical protein